MFQKQLLSFKLKIVLNYQLRKKVMKLTKLVLSFYVVTLLFGCSISNNNDNRPNKLTSNNHQLKTYLSNKIQCGASTVYFESECYDEFDGLSDRGSSGGVRNYCQNIKLHVNTLNRQSEKSYPIMPNYLINTLKSEGYVFSDILNVNDITPVSFACGTMENNNYILINYATDSNIQTLTQNSVILSESGEHVSQKIYQTINELNSSELEIQQVETANILYIGE